jgi:hypothetical protein
MDFYADLDQLAYQYERLADEEKAKAETGEHACPDYWGGVAAGAKAPESSGQKHPAARGGSILGCSRP